MNATTLKDNSGNKKTQARTITDHRQAPDNSRIYDWNGYFSLKHEKLIEQDVLSLSEY